MTKIDIFSGFLGAGKTTLIKKLIKEAYAGEKLVLIENEFGETGIDGGFLKESGIQINEMNSGCICCSLVGDFAEALSKVLEEYAPDRILIEPSGVGKLSDVIKAVLNAENGKAVLNAATVVVDANKCKMYMKNFGEFFNDQIENAKTIILSRTADISEEKLNKCTELLREHNKDAAIITTDWDALDGKQILSAMESAKTLEEELEEMKQEHHHHHHHDHDEHCGCGCHHDHDEHEHHHEHHHDHEHGEDCKCGCHDHDHEHHEHHDHEHEHHHEHDHKHDHHDHDEHCECGCHDHEHHHEHGEHCSCGCHDHDHHHHHADDVFSSWGMETAHKFTKEAIEKALVALDNQVEYGFVLRAKGIVALEDGTWAHFDYVPGEYNVRTGSAEVTGKICVIGSKLAEDKLASVFGL